MLKYSLAVSGILVVVFIGYFGFLDENNQIEAGSIIASNEIKLGMLNSKCKPDNLPYLVAKENNYFSDVKINEVEIDGNIKFGDARAYSDKYDVLVTGRAQLYYMEATQPSAFKVFIANVNTLEKPDYAVLVKNNSGVKDISQLKNKNIGLERTSGKAKYVLMGMVLEKLGLNPTDFKITEATIDDLRDGRVDALYVREPQLSLAIASGEYKSVLDAPIVNYIMSPWPQGFYAVSSAFVKNNPQSANTVIQSLNKAVDFIEENPQRSKEILSKCIAENYAVNGVDSKPFEYWKVEEFDKEAIQKQINLYHEKQLIPKTFSIGDFILK